jgi:transposase InsO family protein
VNAKWVCRLYREMGLQLRNKSPKRRVKAQLRRDYNEVRPHSAIGNQVPAALHRSAGNPGQPAAQ